MTQEFTATRTMLANAMATAGAELLQYMGTAGALAAIPDTDPQQYVVAGTLQIIGKLLPAVQQGVQPELTDERIREIYEEAEWGTMGAGMRYARAIEREVRSAAQEQARNEAPEPERMSTDEAREYLVKFMEQHFTDKTFHRYIRDDATRASTLAGDFAWQMARALRMIEAPAASKEGDSK